MGVGDGQGGLACCDSWGHKESDTTEQLSNWTELNLVSNNETKAMLNNVLVFLKDTFKYNKYH